MRKQQVENAAYEVATQVRVVEDSIESALSEIAELQARIVRANAVMHTGFGTAQPALQQLASAIAGLVETRGAIVGCHVALADAKGTIPGLRTVAFGDGTDCPPPNGLAELRIVA